MFEDPEVQQRKEGENDSDSSDDEDCQWLLEPRVTEEASSVFSVETLAERKTAMEPERVAKGVAEETSAAGSLDGFDVPAG